MIKETDYTEITKTKISEELEELIRQEDGDIIDDIIDNCQVITVSSPFILPDNEFDLREANNDLLEINVKRVKNVSFTGGNFYIEFIKDGDDDCYVIQGNQEQGYNIFNLI